MLQRQKSRYRSVLSSRSRRNGFKSLILVALALLGVFCLARLSQRHSAPGHDGPQQNPTIGKVTMLYGNNSIYEKALETHQEHTRKFGYPLFILRRPILENFWNKNAILLSILLAELAKPLEVRLQWLFWFDADTVLMNPNMPLEIFLPPPDLHNIHLLLTKDWNGLNNGVFLLRVHPWSIKLLSAATAYPLMKPDIELYWHDQSALANLFDESTYFSDSVVYCPLRWFNAYMRSPNGEDLNPDSPPHLQVHPGDLLVHFPGTPSEKLRQTIEPYINISQAHRTDWELPLEKTRYREETQMFWQNISQRI